MLKVHMSRKDGHGKNRKCFITDFFYLQKTSLCCPVGCSYLLCGSDPGLIWTCWCSLQKTLHSVWACLPWDTELQSKILPSGVEVHLKADRVLHARVFLISWNYSSSLSASYWHLSLRHCVYYCFLSTELCCKVQQLHISSMDTGSSECRLDSTPLLILMTKHKLCWLSVSENHSNNPVKSPTSVVSWAAIHPRW